MIHHDRVGFLWNARVVQHVKSVLHMRLPEQREKENPHDHLSAEQTFEKI